MAIREMKDGVLTYQTGREKIRIEAWGKDSLRVRATRNYAVDTEKDWALLPRPDSFRAEIREEVLLQDPCLAKGRDQSVLRTLFSS